jgi:hypothetical protein
MLALECQFRLGMQAPSRGRQTIRSHATIQKIRKAVFKTKFQGLSSAANSVAVASLDP